MNSLTKLEFLKLIRNKPVRIACCVVILYILVVLIGNITSENYYKYDYNANEVGTLKGLKAIKEERLQIKTIAGFLDEGKVKGIIGYYKELISKDKAAEGDGLSEKSYERYWQKYSGIQLLIGMSYSSINTIDTQIIGKLSEDDSKRFYSNRVKKIEEYLNQSYRNSPFDNNDKISIINAAKSLKTPLYFDYKEGWSKVLKGSHFFNIVIILVLCFCNCIIFTNDYQNGMTYVVRATINGKNKLAYAKIKASLIFSTLCFILFHIIYFGGFTLFYGFSGWNCPIQIDTKFWLSIYNLKFYQAYLMMLFIALCTCIFMITCTLLFANILKKAFLSISVVAVLMLIPAFINTKSFSKGLTNLVELFPVKAINIGYSLTQQYFYNILGNPILRCYITPFVLIIGTIILIPIIIRVYSKLEA
jgi:hypothetical protein